MVDIDLLVDQLRKRGYNVESVIKTPSNAGDYEFIVDGNMLNLDETRALLADAEGDDSTPAEERAAAPDTSNPSAI